MPKAVWMEETGAGTRACLLVLLPLTRGRACAPGRQDWACVLPAQQTDQHPCADPALSTLRVRMQGSRISSFTDRDEGVAVKLQNRGGWTVPELAIRTTGQTCFRTGLRPRASIPLLSLGAEPTLANAVWVESGERQHANGYRPHDSPMFRPRLNTACLVSERKIQWCGPKHTDWTGTWAPLGPVRALHHLWTGVRALRPWRPGPGPSFSLLPITGFALLGGWLP